MVASLPHAASGLHNAPKDKDKELQPAILFRLGRPGMAAALRWLNLRSAVVSLALGIATGNEPCPAKLVDRQTLVVIMGAVPLL